MLFIYLPQWSCRSLQTRAVRFPGFSALFAHSYLEYLKEDGKPKHTYPHKRTNMYFYALSGSRTLDRSVRWTEIYRRSMPLYPANVGLSQPPLSLA